MGVDFPSGIIKNIVPIVMAGVLGIYGLIVSVIITQSIKAPTAPYGDTAYSLFNGYAHLASGLCCGISCLAAGGTIGVIGDVGVRGFGLKASAGKRAWLTGEGARVIERAKTDDLVDGSSASCNELDRLIAVDREAVEFENEKIDAMDDPAQKAKVKSYRDKIQGQIDRLKVTRKEKGCASAQANLKQKSDFNVYKRADENSLNSARVIQRAKDGQLVDGSGATCDQLAKIINQDKQAVQFEKDKLEALGSKADPLDVVTVDKALKAIEAQVTKLAGLQKTKGCL